ncbi:MAG TPA: hypothetical protein VJN88_02960 [Ktedonobacterales bacterium]|nr:hypothetical protein [Ktedonobacterales bacterium]
MRARALRLVVALVAVSPLLAVAVAVAPEAHAGGGCVSGPCIHWDTNMVYSGLNNGNPEGPVGENVTIHGGGYPNGATISFAVVPGDLLQSTPQTFCASSAKVALSGATTSNATGAFNFSFAWPAAAGSGDWSVCSYDAGHSPYNALDDGPFSVLSSSPVAVSATKPSFQLGETVTVTGLNWLPGGQRQITAYIGACVDCATAPIVSAATTSGADGSFTVNLTIPASAALGSYFVSANGYTGLLDVGQTGSIPITVVAAIPTATTLAPTATSATTSTATVPATNTTATSGGARTGSSGGTDNTTLLIGLIIGLVVLLAALAGLIAFIATRRKAAAQGPGAPPAAPPAPVPAPTPAYRPPPGANAPYGIPDYGALPMPDWQEPVNAWDRGATSLPDDDTTIPGQYAAADPLSELYPSPLPPQPPAPSAQAPDAGKTRADGDGQTRASDDTEP